MLQQYKKKIDYFIQGSIFEVKYLRYIGNNVFDSSFCIKGHKDVFVEARLRMSSINQDLAKKITELFNKKFPTIK